VTSYQKVGRKFTTGSVCEEREKNSEGIHVVSLCLTFNAARLILPIMRRIMPKKHIKPIHPGEVLMEEFLKPMNLSQNRLALDISVPPRRINEIVLGKRAITADTALRLGRYFRMSPQFWLGLQMDYDLDITADKLAKRLDREVKTYAVAA
jgi:antitoxin HigA-1